MCLIMTERGWVQLSNGKRCVNENNLEGVFRPSTASMAEIISFKRATQYADNIQHWQNGDLEFERVYNCWRTPIHGAFGEVL